MRDVRRAIHANPELSHEETATAALVRRELVAAGLSEIVAVAGTGLVVSIRGRRDGEHVPGAMFRLGVRNSAKGIVHPLHHSELALDEEALPIGAAVFLRAAWRFLEAGTVEPAPNRTQAREGGRCYGCASARLRSDR